MLSDRCLSCLSVTLVYYGQTVGWIKMKLGMQVGLGPGHIVLDGDPAPLPKKGTEPPNFRSMPIVAKRLDATWYEGRPRPRPHCVTWRSSSPWCRIHFASESCALVYWHIGSITARHSSSGRQPNFAALSRQRDVYSAGRPSRWAFAHFLDVSFSVSFISQSCLVSFWLHVNIVNRIVSQVFNA